MNAIDVSIAAALGSKPLGSAPAAGGCIHEAHRLDLADGRQVFVKTAPEAYAALLATEARGLAKLAPHIHVPATLGQGVGQNGRSWLALEWLDLSPLTHESWAALGRGIAALHAVTAAVHGLDHPNFIGTTPQLNSPHKSWSGFYIDQRLRPQIRRAIRNGHDIPEAHILNSAEHMLADHQPAPALLHGDLWTGNTAALDDGGAIVFDPAPYHGDPETDLAMLELFGGPLPDEFLRNYGPMPDDRKRRQPLYDLYHALNHLNLFGSGYSGMVRRCAEALR